MKAPPSPKKAVISWANIPTKLTAIHLALLYVLYSAVFHLPLWADVTAGILLLLLLMGQAKKIGEEAQTSIFD